MGATSEEEIPEEIKPDQGPPVVTLEAENTRLKKKSAKEKTGGSGGQEKKKKKKKKAVVEAEAEAVAEEVGQLKIDDN